MAWHKTGNKPLPELMMTLFNDTYLQPQWVTSAESPRKIDIISQ